MQLTDAERSSVDTSEWKKLNHQAEDLAGQLKKQVDDALKQSAQIQYVHRFDASASW